MLIRNIIMCVSTVSIIQCFFYPIRLFGQTYNEYDKNMVFLRINNIYFIRNPMIYNVQMSKTVIVRTL